MRKHALMMFGMALLVVAAMGCGKTCPGTTCPANQEGAAVTTPATEGQPAEAAAQPAEAAAQPAEAAAQPAEAAAQPAAATAQPADAAAQPAAAAGEDMAALVDKACTSCHSINKIKDYTGTEPWKDLVARMKVKGASLLDDQVEPVAAYLDKTYPHKN